MKTFVFLIFLLVGCLPSSNKESGREESIMAELGKRIEEDLTNDSIGNSISVVLVKDNQVIWSKAFGYSDGEKKVLADTSTIYRTGSISKSFTAFLMMQLADEGIISLNDPVEMYLPEINSLKGYSNETKITFIQLATHTSGLIREPELENAASGPIENWENKIIESIPLTHFESKPGENFSYSNIGYGILGLALSRAAHKPFMELVTERIFLPLHMNNSFFKIPSGKLQQVAKGIGGEGGPLDMKTPEAEHAGRGYKVPNGGIYSTANDLAKFMIACMGHQALLKPESLERMQTRRDPHNYGVGFFIRDDHGFTVIEHGGSVAGYTAQFIFEKGSRYGIVFLRNSNIGSTDLSTLSYDILKELTAP